jgi:hypothetical protein
MTYSADKIIANPGIHCMAETKDGHDDITHVVSPLLASNTVRTVLRCASESCKAKRFSNREHRKMHIHFSLN